MKRVLSLILFFCSSLQTVYFGFDVGSFFPTNDIIQDIYGKAWPNFTFFIDDICPFKCVPQISFFGQVDYLFKNGCSLNFYQKTRIQLVPVTIGLKWIQPLNDCVDIYFGVAPRYYFMHINNYSEYVPYSSNENGCGAYVTIGSYIYLVNNFMINLFFAYSHINFKAPCSTPAYVSFKTNISGFNIGAGIGYEF